MSMHQPGESLYRIVCYTQQRNLQTGKLELSRDVSVGTWEEIIGYNMEALDHVRQFTKTRRVYTERIFVVVPTEEIIHA